MTIVDATQKLVEFFVQNDSFVLARDFNKIVLVSDTDADKAAILIALDGLAKQNFVIKKDFNGQEFWVLQQSLTFHTQVLTINLMTAINLATILNNFIENEVDKANPMEISEKDLVNLCLIVNELDSKTKKR